MQACWGVGSSLKREFSPLALPQWGKVCGNWEGVDSRGTCPNASPPLPPRSPVR